MVERLAVSAAPATALQTDKGRAFIVISAALALLHSALARTDRDKAKFKALAEQPLAGVYVVRGGRLLYANPKLAEVFGYAAEELVALLSVGALVADEDRNAVVEYLERHERGEGNGVHRIAFRGQRRDGTVVHVEVFSRRTMWDRAPAVLGLLIGATERRPLEERPRPAQHLEPLAEVTGAIAHDFNNLLTAIIGSLDLALEALGDSDAVRSEIAFAQEAAERAASLTRQLLSHSRQRVYRPRPVDLNRILRGLKELLTRLAGHSVNAVFDLFDGLPAVEIDSGKLEQVVVNLVINARDAMPGGGTVTIRTQRASWVGPSEATAAERPSVGGAVILTVTDTGEGMDPETQARIFDPFFTTKEHGTGLGLSSVYGIVRQAGGAIQVDSAPGKGATFSVWFPPATGVAEARPSPARPETAPVAGRRGQRVLVVEDDAGVRSVLRSALVRVGYEVLVTSEPAEARRLATADAEPVDLFILDVVLPGTSGPRLAGEIWRARPNATVVYISAYARDEVFRGTRQQRKELFLEKPFTLSQLYGTVRAALGEPDVKGSATESA